MAIHYDGANENDYAAANKDNRISWPEKQVGEHCPNVRPLGIVRSQEWRIQLILIERWIPAPVGVYDVPHGRPIQEAVERKEPGPVMANERQHRGLNMSQV